MIEPRIASAHDLGNGLTIRWSNAEDTEKIAKMMSMIWRGKAEHPPNPRILDQIRLHMRDDFPWMEPTDFALIEDTQKPNHPIVACGAIWYKQWSYGNISFAVGQPEDIATHPDYRNRGLVREIMAWLHDRSDAEDHLVQMIAGIPNFYRQFGYEYAIDFGGKRVTYLSLIPTADSQKPEPYKLRSATVEDVPLIVKLYQHRQSQSTVRAIWTEDECRYAIRTWEEVENGRIDPAVCGINDRLLVIIDESDCTCGYVQVATKRRHTDFAVYALEVKPFVNLFRAMPSLLRTLAQFGEQVPTSGSDIEPLREIAFMLGRSHPAYEVLGESLAPVYEPPYAWYVRLPDPPAFLQHVKSVLERRLVGSAARGYTGELAINFYRGGIQLVFERGSITTIQPWQIAPYGPSGDAALPSHLFVQLIFGYRSMEELKGFYPDVWASDKAMLLLNTLFPKISCSL